MKMKTHLPKTAKLIKCEEKTDEDPLSREWCAAQCSPMPRAMCAHLLANIFYNVYYLVIGLQKLWNPAIPDGKTWSKFGEHGEHGIDGKHHPDDLKHSISWHLWQRLKNIGLELGDHGPRSLFLHGNISCSFQNLSNRFSKLLAGIFHNVSIFHVFCLIHFNILIDGVQTFLPLFSIMSVIL